MPNTKEKKFSNALRDIFVGAEIEGGSRYVNLIMKCVKQNQQSLILIGLTQAI